MLNTLSVDWMSEWMNEWMNDFSGEKQEGPGKELTLLKVANSVLIIRQMRFLNVQGGGGTLSTL